MISAPTLITSRLILRAPQLDDVEAMHVMRGDEAVNKHIGGRTPTRQESWFRFLRYLGHWQTLGFGYFSCCDRQTGVFIGEMGIADNKRGFHPDFDHAPEAGWVLVSKAFGKGYTTEAMGAILDWYDGAFGKCRTVCMIETPHSASINVAAKLGYRSFAEAVFADHPVTLFER
jgi:RimJ/RimL family protein N-acetyltransferase